MAEPHSWENSVYLFGSRVIVRQSAQQGNQFKISHFLASVEACNLLLNTRHDHY